MRARENPFRTERIGHLAYRPSPAWFSTGVGDEALAAEPGELGAALCRRLDTLGGRGTIVGAHGSGKTTLLRDLDESFRRRGHTVTHWFANASEPAPRTAELLRDARRLGAGDVLLFDGAEHLSRAAWGAVRWASRAAGALVITAHAPSALPTLCETRATRPLLDHLVDSLVGEGVARELAPLLDRLMSDCAGNLREVLLALYDRCAADAPSVAPCLAAAVSGVPGAPGALRRAGSTNAERGRHPVRGADPVL